MRLDLGELNEKESREFKGFNDRLLACLPGLNEHQCSLGRPGGFVQRLEEGTYFGHVEHVAIELSRACGRRRKSRQDTTLRRPAGFKVAIEYKAEQASRDLTTE
jgi:cyanophycin synthetase